MAKRSGPRTLQVGQRTLHVVILTVIFFARSSAQMVPGSVALTTAVGQGSDVGLSYAVSGQTRINLGLGFTTITPDSGTARSTFSVQPGIWIMLPSAEGLSAFYGGGVEFRSTSGASSKGDLGLIVQGGAEYAFSRQFAVGSSIGLSYRFGDTSADGWKGSTLTTARVGVFLTWWFM